MLQVANWVRFVVAAVVIAGLAIALPNALPDWVRAKIPAWLPSQTVALGLDLQGGSYLLLHVDMDSVYKDKISSLKGDIHQSLSRAHPHIYYTVTETRGDSVTLRLTDPSRYSDTKALIQALNPMNGAGVLAAGTRSYDATDNGRDTFTMKMTDTFKVELRQDIVAQSVEVVRKRIDALGTREPSIERQGDDRIVVQVPGLSDPQRLEENLAATAKMTFQLVDEAAERTGGQAVPPDDDRLPLQGAKGQPVSFILVKKEIMVAGDRLTNATFQFDQQRNIPVVAFTFDSLGAKQFGDVTKAYPPRTQRFAIVLDGQVVSAPTIEEPILGGSGVIQGSFTVQSATDLAALLRAGALPAPLKVISSSTVGSSLGDDQVKAGAYSALAGLVLVALFMIARYGLFGLFADIALTLNIILLLAILTLMGATLTLPGIAGIVLTMGMAVDANVLIYERIREEQRNGRTMLASIDQGFQRARATITDANSTHLIAAMILFELGSGPVRGFAVTLGVGIATSFFTAVMVTRLIVIGWLNLRRPKRLAI